LLFIALALSIIGVTALSNVVLFPRLGRQTGPGANGSPLVSVLIPARDEAAVIGDTVSAWLGQTYKSFELILLDDQSSDGTAAAARRDAAGDTRLRIIDGQPLPSGWLGKNWACHQLSQAAAGELLLFSDADVHWQPGGLQALIDGATRLEADMATVWPTQQSVTWSERLVVPLMALAILGYLPVIAVHYLPWPVFAAANGQCLLFRRAAYDRVGGHAAVAGEVVEDVMLARRIKAAGLRLRMMDGNRLVGCRMYTSWPGVRDGFAKNILSGHAGSVPFLALSTMFHWTIFVLPWLLWPFNSWFAFLAGVGVLIRGLTAAFTRQRLLDALLMPVSVLLMTLIAGRAVWWHYRGGPLWKGRVARV
jgi:chlorobactene glucosyltransferase